MTRFLGSSVPRAGTAEEPRNRGTRGTWLLLAILTACSTPHPTGQPFAPITATSSEQALRELTARSSELNGARGLVHIRMVTPQRTQSFNAQLQLDREAMALIAYTPLNTTALRMYADDNGVVFVNDLQHTAWRGSAAEFAAKYPLFGGVAPRDLAKLMIGLPATSANVSYDATNAGLARAREGDAVVTYDPPSFPPSRVTVTRGAERLEIEVNELVVSSEKVDRVAVPPDYAPQ